VDGALEAPFPARFRISSPPCACRPRRGIVGAIIGEQPSSIAGGLGGAILNFAQYYNLQPANLWATNIIAALLRHRVSS